MVEGNKALAKKGVSSYNILMRETSDVMQNLATTYGERNTMEYCIFVLVNKIKNTKNKKYMMRVFRLFGAECIQRDLAFYIIQGVINK